MINKEQIKELIEATESGPDQFPEWWDVLPESAQDALAVEMMKLAIKGLAAHGLEEALESIAMPFVAEASSPSYWLNKGVTPELAAETITADTTLARRAIENYRRATE